MKKTLKLLAVIFTIFLLIGCNGKKAEKTLLPDLNNKTKTEIETIFNNFKENVSLKFSYEYNNDIDENVFIKYEEPAKVGDEIKSGDEVKIVLSHEKLYLPNLDNKNTNEVLAAFSDITEVLGKNGLKVNLKYLYPTDNQEDLFVSYLNGKEAGDVILKNSTINISLIGSYAVYPEIENLTTAEIEDLFLNLFSNYEDVSYEVIFKDYYDKTLTEGTVSYLEGINANDVIENLNEIIIKRSFKTLVLPDLNGLKKFEIEDLFLSMNIPLTKLDFKLDYSQYVQAGEFIRYGGYEIGDPFDLDSGRITIYYDTRPILLDLEGYNKFQIEQAFLSTYVNLTFEYVLDNSKEYDTFKGYKNHEPGDEITNGMNLVVEIYKNDDVNVFDEINVKEQLMFSKYISGLGSNLGVELYNPTDNDIILDDYYIAIILGRQVVANAVIQLTGTIKSKETYVIVNVNSSPELIAKSNMQTSLMNFGANSTIQLRRTSNDTYIDTIYDINNTDTLFDREIMVRKGELTHGRRNALYSEWIGFVPDFYDIVGVHPYDGPEDPEFELIADKTFPEYGMTKVKFLSAADGDTVYLESLDPRDTTNYAGNNRIRFLIIDTPETEKPGQAGQPYAQVAATFTRNMLSNASEIYLQASVEGGLIDTYGRHLGLIWANIGTPENPNWKLLNYELLKAGLGDIFIAKTGNYQNHPVFSNRYLYSWAQQADRYAQENKLGLYSGVHRD